MANFISKSITIKWEGSDHKIAVTNELCNELESNGTNLYKMHIDLNSGKIPKMFLLGHLITLILKSDGVDVDQHDVMKKLVSVPTDSISIYKFASAFINIAIPAGDDADVGKSQPETAQK
jgi:hypothetical protein|tara:strand:+ start:309 stop:668 length:360 start_codon:yes stop_codon:yes gene_type:complete